MAISKFNIIIGITKQNTKKNIHYRIPYSDLRVVLSKSDITRRNYVIRESLNIFKSDFPAII